MLLVSPTARPGEATDADRPPVRVVRVKAVADEAFRDQKGWEREIREHVEWSDEKLREIAAIGLELVSVEPWRTHESASMSLLLDELRVGVEKGEADAVIGFSGHPPPVSMIHLRGGPVRYPLPFTAGIAFPLGDRAVIRRTSWKKLTRHTLVHEVAHLFGALHVDEKSLMQTGTDRTDFRLDPFNRRVLELTRERDFDQDIRDLPLDTRDALVELYREAPLRDASDPDTAIRIAYLYLASGAVDTALGEFEKAMEIAPGRSREILQFALIPELEAWAEEHGATVRSRHMLGQAYFVAEQWLPATLQLTPNCTSPVEDAPSCALLGAVLLKAGDLGGAERYLVRATRLDDALPEAYNTLGSVYAVAGRYEDALRHYDRARELDPDNLAIHYNEGLTWLALERPGPAGVAFAEALRLREDHDEARAKLALALARQGKTKEARKTVRPLEGRNVLPALVLRDMAEVYFLSGDRKKAFRHLQLAKKGGVDVEAVEALMQKGPGRPREVETEDLIEQARAYHRTGQNGLARELLQEAARRDPEDPWVDFWLARVAAEEDDRREAEGRLHRALEHDPDFAPAHYELARIAYRHEEHARVVEWLELYVQHADDPGSPAWYMLARSHYELGQLPEAERHFKAAVQRRADYGDAFYHLAQIYLKQGRADAAANELELAVGSRSLSSWRRPEAHAQLAGLLRESGDLEEARRHARIAARLGWNE